MKLAMAMAVAALLAANPFHAGDDASRSRHLDHDAQNLQKLTRKPSEPAPTPIVPGSAAPDFTWETSTREWRKLHDLLAQGPVLLVIAAREPQLEALERERNALLDLGVIPAAVVDHSVRSAEDAAKRLKLGYTMIPDPRAVIARQFNALAPKTNAPEPCWFVIDRKGTVRALDRTGLPEKGYAKIAREALALPAPDAALPATR